MLYKYGQIECAGWYNGKQNVLTGTTYIKISRKCNLPLLLDNQDFYYAKWAWFFCFAVVFSGTLNTTFVQMVCLYMEYLCLKRV